MLIVTAHVVGFGLQGAETAALECLASETGGRYFDAGDARGLRDAQYQTLAAPEVQQAEAPQAPPTPLATLEAPETAGRATQIEVSWTGPAREGDYIDIVPFDGAGTHAYASQRVVADSDTVVLTMPAELGEYVLRYMRPMTQEERAATGGGESERSLAVRSSAAVDVDNFLRAPDRAMQGATISVDWAGPPEFLGLYYEGQTNSDAWLGGMSLSDVSPVEMHMPLDEGAYTLRYFVSGAGNSSGELAAEDITITAAQVGFNAPEIVAAGTDFSILWSGPGGPRDWIGLADPLNGGLYDGYDDDVHSYAFARNSSEDRALPLTAPETPGTYELHYIAAFNESGRAPASGRALLHSQTLTVATEAPEWSEDIGKTDAAPVAPVTAQAAASGAETTPSETGDAMIGDDLGYLCEEQRGRLIEDRDMGISFFLRPAWGTDFPYRDGHEAPVRINFFDTATGAQLSLNAPAEMTEGLLCLPSTVGPVYNLTPDEPGAISAASVLLQTTQPLN